MYRLHQVLKDRSDPPTDDELVFASAKTVMDAGTANAYFSQVETV